LPSLVEVATGKKKKRDSFTTDGESCQASEELFRQHPVGAAGGAAGPHREELGIGIVGEPHRRAARVLPSDDVMVTCGKLVASVHRVISMRPPT
jgi:hypothetical protein